MDSILERLKSAHASLPKIMQILCSLKTLLFILTTLSFVWLCGMELGLILTATITIHELGHVLAMRHYGLKVKGMYLIPFIGGIAVSKEKYPNLHANIGIALAGPLMGLIATLLCYFCYLVTNNLTLAMATTVSSFVNLFNLIPLPPFDGGQIMKALTKGLKLLYSIPVSTLSITLYCFGIFNWSWWIVVMIGVTPLYTLLYWSSERTNREIIQEIIPLIQQTSERIKELMETFPPKSHHYTLLQTSYNQELEKINEYRADLHTLPTPQRYMWAGAYTATCALLWIIIVQIQDVPHIAEYLNKIGFKLW